MGITKNPEWANICVLEITFVFIVKKQRDTYIVLNQGTVIYFFDYCFIISIFMHV